MKITYTESAPEPVGPYSQGIISGNMFYSSGQIGINPDTLKLVEGGITGQTRMICENLKAVLASANLSLEKVVKVNIFLTNIQDYEPVNNIYKDYFSHRPARSCVAVAELPAGAIVEIEIIAELS